MKSFWNNKTVPVFVENGVIYMSFFHANTQNNSNGNKKALKKAP